MTNVGDPKAIQRLKEEIVYRLADGNSTVVSYLINESYLDYLNLNEWEIIVLDEELDIVRKLITLLDQIFRGDELLAEYIVNIIETLSEKHEIKKIIKKVIFELMYYDSDYTLVEIIS